MPPAAAIPDALAVTLLLLTLYAGLPALLLVLRCRRPPLFETLWLASGLLIALQALLGTLLTPLAPSPAWNLALLPLFALLASTFATRLPRKISPPDPWLLPLLLLALTVRLLAPLQHHALGQSDAYSHLQFLRDMVTTGHLRHSFYPPGHARVTAPALWISALDLYPAARFAGAAYGLGLTAGLYALARQLHSRTAARTAALLAAAFPPFAPLLRTGVGLYANQLGLLLIPLLLWTLTLLAREGAPRRLLGTFALLAAALLVSVPMMLLDLLPAAALLLLPRLRPRLRLPALLLLLAAALLLAARLPTDTLQRTANIFTRQDQTATTLPPILLQLARDYLHWKTPPVSPPQRLVIGLLALLAAAALLRLHRPRPELRPLLLLTALSGLQTATGILQFTSYQRAGWIFLLCLCLLGGLLAGEFTRRLPRLRFAPALLLPVCLLTLLHPPHPPPHLSPAEEQLVTFLLTLRRDHRACTPHEPLHLWSRAFTRFDGGQGDPLPALLEDRPCIRLHRILPDTPLPNLTPGTHLILLDTGTPAATHDPVFTRERDTLLRLNTRLEQFLDTERTTRPDAPPTLRHTAPGFTVHELKR